MSDWMQDLFHIKKPIIAMCHLQSLPGDPCYDADGDMKEVIAATKVDLLTLQGGGVDGIISSNEFSLPYPARVEPVTMVAMARVIGELKPLITIPYGVNYLWDPIASIDLAVIIDGKPIREIISDVHVSDSGLWNTNVGETVCYKMAVGTKGLKSPFNIVPEAVRYLVGRDIKDITRSTEFNNRPNVLCVFDPTTGSGTGTQIPGQVKASVKHTSTLCSTGRNVDNITRQLSVADGAVYAATFRYGGVSENTVDVK